MNPYRLISAFVIFTLVGVLFSCSKEDDVPYKSYNRIISIAVQTSYSNNQGTPQELKEYQGTINHDESTIYFDIPSHETVDITKLYLTVNLPVEAYIKPGLAGPKDLSSPYEVIVTAGNGDKKVYTLLARLI